MLLTYSMILVAKMVQVCGDIDKIRNVEQILTKVKRLPSCNDMIRVYYLVRKIINEKMGNGGNFVFIYGRCMDPVLLLSFENFSMLTLQDYVKYDRNKIDG